MATRNPVSLFLGLFIITNELRDIDHLKDGSGIILDPLEELIGKGARRALRSSCLTFSSQAPARPERTVMREPGCTACAPPLAKQRFTRQEIATSWSSSPKSAQLQSTCSANIGWEIVSPSGA